MPLTELWLSAARKHAALLRERIRLGHELDRGAGVGGEADVVRRFVDVEKAQQPSPRVVDDLGARARRRGVGVRIAEDAVAQKLVMRAKLRVAVQRAAGVVEIRVMLRVEPAELAVAQLVEKRARVDCAQRSTSAPPNCACVRARRPEVCRRRAARRRSSG